MLLNPRRLFLTLCMSLGCIHTSLGASANETFCPVENFQPCGGSLEGVWNLRAHCTEPGVELPCEFPFDNEKACLGLENTVHCRLNVSGTMSFSEKMLHLQRHESIDARYTFSESCTAAVRPEAGSAALRCASLSRPPIMSCSLEKNLCTCEAHIIGEPNDATVSYSVQKQTLKFDEFVASYCVRGDQLTLNFEPHPMSWKFWVLTR